MPGVPRIVNDVSNATDINHESHFAWQAQYLVMSECHSLLVAGAAFGNVGVSLFVAGAVFGEIWAVDSRSAKCCNFQYKMRLRSAKSNLGERAGAR